MKKHSADLENILVITASKPLVKELKKTLSSYNIVAVKNAKEAIKLLFTDKNFATIIAGIFMPETKGFDFLDFVKANPEFYKGPVLVITDTISDSVIEKTKDYNIFDFVVRYSDDIIINTRIRNAVIYYTETKKLLNYAVENLYSNFVDIKMILSLLAQMIEFKNQYYGRHVDNVGAITSFICHKLNKQFPDKYNFSTQDIAYISLAATLHDIGKAYVSDEILNKPGKLDELEYKIYKTHTTLGAAAIDRLYAFKDRPMFKYAHDVCLYHHEKLDGTGYPSKLTGDQIPIAAQIVAVVDRYDSLTSTQAYREAMSHSDALSILFTQDTGKYNSDVLECLLDFGEDIKRIKEGSAHSAMSKAGLSTIISEVCKVK